MPYDSKLAKSYSVAAITVLTAGFFLYDSGIRSELFPPFLGGYLGLVTVSLAPFALIAYIISSDRRDVHFTKADLFLLVTAAVIASIASSYLGHLGAVSYIAQSHVFVAVQFLVFFVSIKFIPLGDSRNYNIWVISLFLLSSLLVGTANLGDTSQLGNQIRVDDAADYQQYATYYTILLFLVSIVLISTRLRYAVYLVGLMVLFINGARSEFAGWVFSIVVLEGLRSKHGGWALIAGALIVVPFFGAATGLLQEYFPDNRVSILIENSSQDQSYIERQESIEQAMETIVNHPIAGDYARYETGRYAHNILAIWQDFGFFGFAAFSVSLLAALGSCLAHIKRRTYDPEFVVFFTVVLMAILLFSLAKAFSSPLYPLAMALYARHLTRIRSPQLHEVPRGQLPAV